MRSEEIRKRFLEFFKARGHAVIPSASLVPENDPSVLFTTAGMQPLVPYLLGEEHPEGKRLVNAQKSMRTTDIDEVGDATHLTFFEMLGNWSLGDYFKKEAIGWSYEFLTSAGEGLGLDPKKLYVTCFEGNEDAPRDDESAEIWKSLGVPESRIYFLGKEDNWWSPGANGPCGPDTEMFYDLTSQGLGELNKDEFVKAADDKKAVEVWNNVFMEYEQKDNKVVGKLAQKNVDTGAGLERLASVLQKVDNVYETDLFEPIMRRIEKDAYEFDILSARIIADHVRASIFLIADGVTPSNTDGGYVLRRLIRRAVRHANKLSFSDTKLSTYAPIVVEKYAETYKELRDKEKDIIFVLDEEEEKFEKTLAKGMKVFLTKSPAWNLTTGEKIVLELNGEDFFELWTVHGFPPEVSVEVAKEKGIPVAAGSLRAFEVLMERHRDTSRAGAEKKFKGGLGDTSEMSVKYHTATHLLNAALRKILGEHVEQKGSNITPERLRFDFSHPEKMTDEQKKEVEDLVNQKIEEALEVSWEEMPLEDARKAGALGVFGEKYADTVKVYSVGDFSKEICGGPHVENTKELGKFKIKKEESVSAGVRRIKAVLE